jgi:hypothetical protein
LQALSEELEENLDTKLFDERSKETGGRTLAEVISGLQQTP